MCRWGCITTDTTFCCKFCGTRFCADCHRGDFTGLMKVTKDSMFCRKCKQPNCQGARVEYIPSKNKPTDKKSGNKTKSAKKK